MNIKAQLVQTNDTLEAHEEVVQCRKNQNVDDMQTKNKYKADF